MQLKPSIRIGSATMGHTLVFCWADSHFDEGSGWRVAHLLFYVPLNKCALDYKTIFFIHNEPFSFGETDVKNETL